LEKINRSLAQKQALEVEEKRQAGIQLQLPGVISDPLAFEQLEQK